MDALRFFSISAAPVPAVWLEAPLGEWETLTLLAYFGVMGLLAVFGLHRLFLVRLYLKHRDVRPPRPEPDGRWPRVTVQLPLYNERFVAQNLLEAVARLDYPADKLEIQALDDSTDLTTEIVRNRVEELAARGVPIRLIHRRDRVGYKAGALQAGLEQAKGELIAIFDADFLPAPDFLQRLVPYFQDPGVGCVQARWAFRNREDSLLTSVQGVMLDSHFVIDQTARSASGRFFNFNGTAGILRRRMIEGAGGWEFDTLTEDTDLSYRGQLAGWKMLYVPEVEVDSELPQDMASFQAQQARWAKGLVETGLKLRRPIAESGQPWRVKLEAFFHFASNLSYPLMALLALLVFPVGLIRWEWQEPWLLLADAPLFVATFGSLAAYCLLPQVLRDGRLRARHGVLFLGVLAMGVALLLSNFVATMEALAGVRSPFQRTAKYSQDPRRNRLAHALYRPQGGWLAWANLAVAGYFSLGCGYLAWLGAWSTLPFMGLFVVGHALAGLLSLGWEGPSFSTRLVGKPAGSSVR